MDPVPLASGRSAGVFAIDERRVLRRYRDGGDATAEASPMSYVAGLGFPVPRVYEATGADLVIERLHGPSMMRALTGGELRIEAAAEILADLHDRLHRLPARSGRRPASGSCTWTFTPTTSSLPRAHRSSSTGATPRRADPGLTAAEIAQLDSAAALVTNSRGESA